jgi:hypothetical protein
MDEIYSNKITKGSRTYFFDIKKSERGDTYLTISESKKSSSGFEHQRIMIFEEDINDFAELLKKSLVEFRKVSNIKSYSIEKIREQLPNAYALWTQEDDNKLELMFCEKKKIKELAQTFGRNERAISSRIKKLELKEKYGY